MGSMVRSNGDGQTQKSRSPQPGAPHVWNLRGTHAGRLFGTRTGSGPGRSGLLVVEHRRERSSEFPVRKLWRTRANTVSLVSPPRVSTFGPPQTRGSVQRAEEAGREEGAGPGGGSTQDSEAAERSQAGRWLPETGLTVSGP